MAKCIVTGGAGFIGSHVVDLLIDQGHEVTVIDDFSTGFAKNLNPKAKLITADLTTNYALYGLGTADFVFHLAAHARIQPSINDPITSHINNVDATLNVLEYCKTSGAKLIFSSSSSVYGDQGLPIAEDGLIGPKSPYALQKLQCEQYIQLYGELYGLDYVILRYFNVYGERQVLSGAYAAVVGIFLDQYQQNKPLTITNDGEQRRDFTYVGDVAQANNLAMGWEKGVYNIGAGHNYSINELVQAFGNVESKKIGDRVGEARATLADNSKAVGAGWQPKGDIKEWIYDSLNR